MILIYHDYCVDPDSTVNEPDPQAISLPPEKYWITHQADGRDILTMIIPRAWMDTQGGATWAIWKRLNAERLFISCEDKVVHKGVDYIVKNIERYGEEDFTVTCEISLEAFKQAYFPSYKRRTTLAGLVSDIVGSEWIVNYYPDDITDTRMLAQADYEPFKNITGLELLYEACKLWEVRVRFLNTGGGLKIVEFVDPDAMAERDVDYFRVYAEGNNFTLTGYTADTTGVVNRLYAYGKQDETTGEYLSFADINSGKPYVDDKTTYLKSHIISAGWIDERYTNKSNLKAAAQKKLRELSRPVIDYQLEGQNLDFTPTLFNPVPVKMAMFDQVQYPRVIEWTEYPGDMTRNTVRLGNKLPDFETL